MSVDGGGHFTDYGECVCSCDQCAAGPDCICAGCTWHRCDHTRRDQPDVAPGPDVDAGGAGDEVYRAAARVYWRDNPNAERYADAGFRAAIDAARAQPLAELADATRLLRTSHEVRTALAADLAQAIRELDQARAILDYALHLRTYGENAPGGNETWREFDRRCETYLRGETTDDGSGTHG
jgi:hypothetical protein